MPSTSNILYIHIYHLTTCLLILKQRAQPEEFPQLHVVHAPMHHVLAQTLAHPLEAELQQRLLAALLILAVLNTRFQQRMHSSYQFPLLHVYPRRMSVGIHEVFPQVSVHFLESLSYRGMISLGPQQQRICGQQRSPALVLLDPVVESLGRRVIRQGLQVVTCTILTVGFLVRHLQHYRSHRQKLGLVQLLRHVLHVAARRLLGCQLVDEVDGFVRNVQHSRGHFVAAAAVQNGVVQFLCSFEERDVPRQRFVSDFFKLFAHRVPAL